MGVYAPLKIVVSPAGAALKLEYGFCEGSGVGLGVGGTMGRFACATDEPQFEQNRFPAGTAALHTGQ